MIYQLVTLLKKCKDRFIFSAKCLLIDVFASQEMRSAKLKDWKDYRNLENLFWIEIRSK